MISLENIITYLGATGIIYCLIKAFCGDAIDDVKIGVIIVIVMVIIIFLTNKNKLTEGYRIVEPPVQDGLFVSADGTVNGVFRPGVDIPVNTIPSPIADTTEPQITLERQFGDTNSHIPLQAEPKRKFNYRTGDQDMIDFMNLSGVDKQKFEEMMFIEDAAKEGIKERYQNEMVYTSSNPFNTVPLGRNLNPYTYLPEFAWYRGYEQPPVCIPSPNDCPTCPLAPSGTTDLMHFDNVDNIRERAPQGINLKYTKRVLNGDRS